jgi:two-component system chemotaxis response regulator CheY
MSDATSAILIVEGDPLVRMSFARALETFGKVEVAASGLDALRHLALKKFDVIVLDLRVPGIDGFAILRTLSSREGPNKKTPVCAVTADLTEEPRLRALREHAMFVAAKPVALDTLKNLVGAALKKDREPQSRGSSPDGSDKEEPPRGHTRAA